MFWNCDPKLHAVGLIPKSAAVPEHQYQLRLPAAPGPWLRPQRHRHTWGGTGPGEQEHTHTWEGTGPGERERTHAHMPARTHARKHVHRNGIYKQAKKNQKNPLKKSSIGNIHLGLSGVLDIYYVSFWYFFMWKKLGKPTESLCKWSTLPAWLFPPLPVLPQDCSVLLPARSGSWSPPVPAAPPLAAPGQCGRSSACGRPGSTSASALPIGLQGAWRRRDCTPPCQDSRQRQSTVKACPRTQATNTSQYTLQSSPLRAALTIHSPP